MTLIPTPATDAEILIKTWPAHTMPEVVRASFARTLERRMFVDRAALVDAAKQIEQQESSIVGYQADIAELKAQIYVPGEWKCPVCSFQLHTTILHPNGASPNLERPEPCPNDGNPMSRVTWKDSCLAADRVGIDFMKKLRALQKALEPYASAHAEFKKALEESKAL